MDLEQTSRMRGVARLVSMRAIRATAPAVNQRRANAVSVISTRMRGNGAACRTCRRKEARYENLHGR